MILKSMTGFNVTRVHSDASIESKREKNEPPKEKRG
jgi:hypothetical protein